MNMERILGDADGEHILDPAWTPFQRAALEPADEEAVQEIAELAGRPMEAASQEEVRRQRQYLVFQNSRYQVVVQRFRDCPATGASTHLSIKGLDRVPARDWRDFQRIKNELVGLEYGALELFPAESRKVDTANQFHLWVLPLGQRVPFGFERRSALVVEAGESRGCTPGVSG